MAATLTFRRTARQFGSLPADSHYLNLCSGLGLDTSLVRKVIEAGLDWQTLFNLIVKDGLASFPLIVSFVELVVTNPNLTAIEGWIVANGAKAYSIAADIATAFGVTLPPWPFPATP